MFGNNGGKGAEWPSGQGTVSCKPVTVFECLDHIDADAEPNLMDLVGLFSDGVRCYRDRDFDKACERFHEALRARPEDVPSQMYLERCAILEKEPPPDDWDGVWVMTEK